MAESNIPPDPIKAVEELKAFRLGMLASLAALKASVQASPNFNRQALEESVLYFLGQPPDTELLEDFEGPLRIPMRDMSDLLKQMKHVE
ncbi:hypothetical protein [Pusillimonas sp.]|uniref:hypothetical protein n=1 Tax=Pusillimonas sp. TaxID=3040095 RepID=UPI0037C503B0